MDAQGNEKHSTPLRIDAHVHIVGNGRAGSGCWLKIGPWHRPLSAFMLRHIGVGVSTSSPHFDEAYVRHLARLVRESSLDAVVILAQDEVYDVNGNKLEFGSFHVPNDYVLRLARSHPEFLPAVSIHPARPDALDELERCLEAGAVMLKLLPNCHNVDCNHAKYRKFWARMAQAGLPLLAHTGGEHTVPVFDARLSHPTVLRAPLEAGVKVIAAHCATKSGLFDPEYFHDFIDMLNLFPNVYGDTSAFNVPIRGRHIRKCLESTVQERLIHGSDYPVPVQGHWAWLQGFIHFDHAISAFKLDNVIERDYQLKAAMGFSPSHFTKVGDLLRWPTAGWLNSYAKPALAVRG